jgi:molybdopterin-guanine dinucleotide biosynthesis protein A
MPFMTAQCLQRTCNRIHSGCGVVPLIGNRAEPLAAIYPAEAFSNFTAALQDGDFSLQTITRQLIGSGKLVAVKVPTRETKFYRNLNQPADLFLV